LRGDFSKSGTRGRGCDKFHKNQILSIDVCRATIQDSKNVKIIILGLFPDYWDFFFLKNGSDFLVKLAIFVVLLKFDTKIQKEIGSRNFKPIYIPQKCLFPAICWP
jgi:hypothetical protein